MDDLINTKYESRWEDFVELLGIEENPAPTNFQILFPNSHKALSFNANGFESLANLGQSCELPAPNFTMTNQPPPVSSETEMSCTEFSNPNAPVTTTTTNNYNTTSSNNQLCIDDWKKRWESDYNLCSTEQDTSANGNSFQNDSTRTYAIPSGVDVYNPPIVRNEDRSPTLETMMAETESSINLMTPKLAFTLGGCKRSRRMPFPPSENKKKLVLSPKLSSPMKTSKNLDQSSPSSLTATSLQDKKKRMMYSQACDILNPLSNNCGNLPLPSSSGLLPVRIGVERPGLAMMGESQFQTSQMNNSLMNSINTLDFKQTSDPCVDTRWHWVTNMKSQGDNDNETREKAQKKISRNVRATKNIKRKCTLDEGIAKNTGKKQTVIQVTDLEPPEPTQGMVDIVKQVKSNGSEADILAEICLLNGYSIRLTRRDLQTLLPEQKLNDNIINSYMGLIAMRSKKNDNFPKVFVFESYFYPKLIKEGYTCSLKRWTRKDDIFEYEMIIIPIHTSNHWTLACIDFRSKLVLHFDSSAVENDSKECLDALIRYISKETEGRKKTQLIRSEWLLVNVEDFPKQSNDWDCGVFLCKTAELISRDVEISFSHKDMAYYRDIIMYELFKQKLMAT